MLKSHLVPQTLQSMTRPRLWAYSLLTLLLFLFIVIIASISLQTKTGTVVIIDTDVPDDFSDEFKSYPVSGLSYTSGIRFGATNDGGNFKYRERKEIIFKLGDTKLPSILPDDEISQLNFPDEYQENLKLLLFSLDEDGNRENGIQITPDSLPTEAFSIDLSLPHEQFSSQLLDKLSTQGRFVYISTSGRSYPIEGLEYISGAYRNKTDADGIFDYQLNKKINFKAGNHFIQAIRGKAEISPRDFPNPIYSNLKQYLLSVDDDSQLNNGIRITTFEKPLTLSFDLDQEAFENSLAKQLSPYARYPRLGFKPSLGINLEAPQAEADSVGQPMPFVDIFRTARPFAELSDEAVIIDENGWPTIIPQGKKAYTLILQSLPKNAIPYGHYTVLYDGVGSIAYDGVAKRVDFSANYDIIDINPDNGNVNQLILRITESSPTDPIRNIRIIMPGGICDNAPFYRVDNPDECAFGKFQAFTNMLEDRNRIVFNPDYLRVLRNFKVLRMMNFMEASQRIANSCSPFKNDEFDDCVTQPLRWDSRSKMEHASWGGSFRTDGTLRRGVPVEVLVALANILKVDPWFTIPHNATDEYVAEFADYIAEHIDPSLSSYIEYSNETWNGRFWGAHYVRKQGRKAGLDADLNPFREGFRYYTKRAVEIFRIWEDSFEGTDKRIIRVVGSYINSPDLSKNILSYENAFENIDALAVAPYFHACWNRAHRDCKNFIGVPSLLPKVKTTNDIFKLLENKSDPYSLPTTIKFIGKQAQIAKEYDVDLVAYEGGQHLAVDWLDQDYTKKQKEALLDLFLQANKDERMGQMYLELLRAWKEAGGNLFVTFTLPQTPHKWGSWGLKEHLNQARNQAPKYQAILQFEEETEQCWWEGCAFIPE
ncbi:MAG: Unknown protein [uncultured Thiotrichaceae bacterium]|uniref:Cellulose-binding domain protein n=1 Tax=uncultured Thiotrichaceae bacterium TaxID=298394 RepID=A0A6S6TZ58_9GAMM|nr:MAG: Unknown protein [uncultured Thiotrichaceae bacterium]